MLGRKGEKKKETREVDIRISDQYQMICKGGKTREKEAAEGKIQALAVWWTKWKLICLPFEISSFSF